MNDDPNPFAAPEDEPLEEYKPQRDPSIEFEPHMMEQEFTPAPGHHVQPLPLGQESRDVAHTVWDEPARSATLSGAEPDQAVTYRRWLQSHIDATTAAASWRAVLLCGIGSGLLGFLITWWSSPFYLRTIFHSTLITPFVQEVVKMGLLAWLVETRPYAIKNAGQLLAGCLVAAVTFVCLESAVPLLGGASRGYVALRLFGGLIVHGASALLVGWGLVQVWQRCVNKLERPQLSLATKAFFAAVLLRSCYNLAMWVLQRSPYWV